MFPIIVFEDKIVVFLKIAIKFLETWPNNYYNYIFVSDGLNFYLLSSNNSNNLVLLISRSSYCIGDKSQRRANSFKAIFHHSNCLLTGSMANIFVIYFHVPIIYKWLLITCEVLYEAKICIYCFKTQNIYNMIGMCTLKKYALAKFF